ncbi:MAG: hypothetical protein HC852_12225 [Acaryochloridaceae cyanobacterium RU_4_10]|nr:hypothetical protein [Acaryochloridaceae cyanobacterium RU_4_10]
MSTIETLLILSFDAIAWAIQPTRRETNKTLDDRFSIITGTLSVPYRLTSQSELSF